MNRSVPIAAVSLLFAGSLHAAPLPPVDTAGFEKIVGPFLENYCLDCHDDATKKGKLSLEGLNAEFTGDTIELWRLFGDQLHFAEMPPEDKDQPTDAERDAVMAWIRGEMLKTQRPGVVADEKLLEPQFGNYVDHQFLFGKRLPFVTPAPPRLWRLRPGIYDSITPSFGEGINGLANGLSLADGSDFKDYAAGYFIDEASTAPLLGNAKTVAEAMVGPKSKDGIFKQLVSEDGPPKDELVNESIVYAFRKILDREPTADEQGRFFAFHQQASATGGHALAGRALLTAILMQPEVLYRQELGDGTTDEHGRTRLTNQEIAYALSYALDDSPVREILEARETFDDNEAIATLLRERLDDPSDYYDRNPRIIRFFREYFDYPNSTEVFKDNPEESSHTPEGLVADLEMTITEILKKDKNVLKELLTTRDYYISSKWGSKEEAGTLQNTGRRDKYHVTYNLPLDWRWSAERQPVEMAEGERAGVLTHPAWLTAWSGNFDNHPVQRGKWIRTHLLGGSVPDVPIGVDARVPEIENTTFRDRLKSATEAPECWRCHRNMDPLGVAFERYDHYGRYQRLDAGQPVDASNAITRTPVPELHGEFLGPTELVEALSNSEYVEQVFVRHVFRFFMGRNETLGDANTLQDAHKAYKDSGGSFRELVVSLLTSDSFLLRQLENKNS